MEKPSLRFRKLSPDTDTHSLQKILEAAPQYSLNVFGAPQPPTAAEQFFSALPPSFSASNKFVYGIELDSSLIGCIDLLRGFPDSATAMLGLLLLRESHQGKGFGREAYRLTEEKLRSWKEIKKIRISVVESNGEVLGFWKKMDFVDTGFRRRYSSGIVSSWVSIFEKVI